MDKYLEASILTRPAFDWITVSLRYEEFLFLNSIDRSTRMFSLRCGHTLIVRLIQHSLQEASQSQLVHGVLKIYAVWSSLEIIAEQEIQLFHQVLMEQIQVRSFIRSFFEFYRCLLNSHY